MNRFISAAVALVGLVSAGTAQAAVFATVTGSNINSDGTQSSPGGTISYTVSGLTGARLLKTINFSAIVERVANTDSAGEKRVGMTAGTGYTAQTLNPGFATYSGSPLQSSVTNKLWDVTDLPVANGSRINFQFYESFGDSGTDAIYRSIQLALEGDVYTPAAPTLTSSGDFGTLTGNGMYASKSGSIFSTGQVNWYRFTLDKAVGGAGGYKFLDFDTNPFSTTNFDSEIGLYDASGHLIATNDESGTGSKSAFSFGEGSGRVLNPGDSTPVLSTGQDGNLAAGTYYLAVAAYNTTFAEDAWILNAGTASSGGYVLSASLGPVPEPASLGALLIAGALVRRRRA